MSYVPTAKLIKRLEQEDRHYREVLSEDSMRVELAQYPNPAPKNPHSEDELYFLVSGSGMVRVGEETHAVDEGDVVYVKQGLEHDFFDIEEEITALVVFVGSHDTAVGRNQ
jgi:mannose-1-phosphate guanylyltransferase